MYLIKLNILEECYYSSKSGLRDKRIGWNNKQDCVGEDIIPV